MDAAIVQVQDYKASTQRLAFGFLMSSKFLHGKGSTWSHAEEFAVLLPDEFEAVPKVARQFDYVVVKNLKELHLNSTRSHVVEDHC